MARDKSTAPAGSVVLGGRAYVSADVAASLLRVTPAHVRRLLRSGRLVGSVLSGRWWVQLGSLRQYESERGPWPVHGVFGGREEAVRQGLVPRKECA